MIKHTEIESHLISRLLLNKEERAVMKFIKPEFFTSSVCSTIFEGIKLAYDGDFTEVKKVLGDKVTFGELSEFVEMVSPYSADFLVRELRQQTLARYEKDLPRKGFAEAEAWMEKTRVLFDDGYGEEVKTLNDIAVEIEDDREKGISLEGFPTGIPGLDEYTYGMVKGKFIIIGGYTSHGKSTLAINILDSVLKAGAKAMFVSLEMTEKEILIKLLACRNGIEIKNFYKKTDNPNIEHDIGKALTDVADQKLQVVNALDDIDDIIAEIKEKKPDIVFIDYLQNLSSKAFSDRRELLEYASKKLALLSLQMNICVVALSQVNEETMKNKGTFSAGLKGSGDMASASDVTLRITREVDSDGVKTDRFGLVIHKNRYGKTGFITLSIDESKGRIYKITNKHD